MDGSTHPSQNTTFGSLKPHPPTSPIHPSLLSTTPTRQPKIQRRRHHQPHHPRQIRPVNAFGNRLHIQRRVHKRNLHRNPHCICQHHVDEVADEVFAGEHGCNRAGGEYEDGDHRAAFGGWNPAIREGLHQGEDSTAPRRTG